jgi:uncharacterized membrane protein SpoIIM required for sporulation
MVLEYLFNPFIVKKKPWEMFFAGFIYTSIALILSYTVFKENTGLLSVFLIVISCLPLLYTTFKNEEELELKTNDKSRLLKEHGKVLTFLLFLFLGITASMSLTYILLPLEINNVIFVTQKEAIINVNNNVSGMSYQNGLFVNIVINNLKVLFFCLVFSFLYGTGALFILTWNASVLSTALGNFFKEKIAESAAALGAPTIAHYFEATSISILRYFTHGLLEMGAYFIAGLAGSIISVALIKKNLEKETVILDVINLIFISIIILLLAAFIEVYITPLIYL